MDIWSKGLERLTAEKTIRLKAHGSHETEGRFRDCKDEASVCSSSDVTLTDITYQQRKLITGKFKYQGVEYQFNAPFPYKKPGICG